QVVPVRPSSGAVVDFDVGSDLCVTCGTLLRYVVIQRPRWCDTIPLQDSEKDFTVPDSALSATNQPLVLGLRQLAQHLTALVESALVPAGITLRHFGVLIAVQANPGLNQREIGEMLHIDRTTVVALADELELAGLLERRRGADRRSFALHLTREGAERTARLQVMVEQVQT